LIAWSRRESGCPAGKRLESVSLGRATSEQQAEVFRHAIDCQDCRDVLVALSLANHPGTVEEEALLARALERPPAIPPLPVPSATPRFRPRWQFRAAVAGLAAAAAVGLVVTTGGDPAEDALATLVHETRPIAGRLSLNLPHAPYQPARSEGAGAARLDGTLEELLARKDNGPSALAVLYLFRNGPGDLERAEQALDVAPAGPERDNDRAVVLLARGRPGEALDLLRGVLAARPDYGPARFNLAVALESLGRKPEAARALRDYLAGADVVGQEAFWVAEARQRLAELEGAAP
jgi:tetratricopeptide (TPR) repeat protein